MTIIKVIWIFLKSAITFILENWKYFLVGGICLFLAYQAQQFRIDGLKADLREKEAEVSALREANASNKNTIDNLKADVTKANSSCSKRLGEKEDLIKKFQKIDESDREGGKTNEGNSTDPVLTMLNGLFNNTSR